MAAFVKFSRGLVSQYETLKRNNKIDNDTLYLIYENTSSETGQLYLGNKLISSTNISSINLSDISDINMPEELVDGMLLQYISQTGKWEAKPIDDVLSNYSGTSSGSGISVVDDLDSIENPHKDDIVIQGKELFIYDGEKWEPLTVSDLENKISNLEEKIGQEANAGQQATGLYKKIDDLREELDTQIDSKIANAQHLRYQVVSSLDDIHLDNEEETKNTVFLVPKNDASADDGYDEYLVDNRTLEKIGSWDADLTNYVQTTDNRLLSDEQKQKLDSFGYDSENHQATITASQVSDLNDVISKSQKIKSVASGTFNITDEGELQLISVPSVDLSSYVEKSVYQAEVGDLSLLGENHGTLVDEINIIKESIIWQDLLNKQNGGE